MGRQMELRLSSRSQITRASRYDKSSGIVSLSARYHMSVADCYSWHHYLKTHLLKGKRNRRLDTLIKTLVVDAVGHFKHRDKRQQLGFEGPSLVEERLSAIEEKSLKVEVDRIKVC
jgi:hypothetical protein